MLWKGFEIKSHQRRAHYLYQPRNGRHLAAEDGMLQEPSTGPIRVNPIRFKYVCGFDKDSRFYGA